MRLSVLLAVLALPALLGSTGCSTSPTSQSDRSNLVAAAAGALEQMEAADSSLSAAIDEAYGYVVFPSAGEGAFIIGGGGGHGVVYQGRTQVGWASIVQVTIGAQIGGQGYSMVILYKDKAAFDAFKMGQASGIAGAQATAATAGATANSQWNRGVKVVVNNQAGLMAAANVGGQTINYEPMN